MHDRNALHPQAFTDLDEIRAYIAENNPDAADRVIDEIFDALEALMPAPHQGHRRPDLTSRPLRFKLVRKYLIVYAPDENPLWIVAVIHGFANVLKRHNARRESGATLNVIGYRTTITSTLATLCSNQRHTVTCEKRNYHKRKVSALCSSVH